MPTLLPTRQDIEQADDLDFDAQHTTKPVRQELRIMIKAQLNGFPIELSFVGAITQLPAITKRLRELGAEAPPSPRTGNWQKPKVELTQPAYDDGGNPICPVHGRKIVMREWDGRTFRCCPAKAKDGEKANKNGYCALRFAE